MSSAKFKQTNGSAPNVRGIGVWFPADHFWGNIANGTKDILHAGRWDGHVGEQTKINELGKSYSEHQERRKFEGGKVRRLQKKNEIITSYSIAKTIEGNLVSQPPPNILPKKKNKQGTD